MGLLSWFRSGSAGDGAGGQGPPDSGDPAALASGLSAATNELEASLARGDAAGAALALSGALALRRILEGLSLPSLHESNPAIALAVASALGPPYEFVVRVLTAGSALDVGDVSRARELLADLGPPRLPYRSAHLLAPLLAPLVAQVPELAMRLHRWSVPLDDLLGFVGSFASCAQIEALGARLEGSGLQLRWEAPIGDAAAKLARLDVIAVLHGTVAGEAIEPGPSRRMLSLDSRRQRLQYLEGVALLRAGRGDEAVDCWIASGNTGVLAHEVATLARKGFPQAAQRLLAALPSWAKSEGRAALGEEAEGEVGWQHALERLAQGDPAPLRAELDRAVATAANAKGRERAMALAQQIRALVLLGQPADTPLAELEKLHKGARKPTARASLALSLAVAEVSLARFDVGVERALAAAGEVEDHDEAYEQLQELVWAGAERGAAPLAALKAAVLDRPEDDFYRARTLAYLAAALASQGDTESGLEIAATLGSIDRDLVFELMVLTLLPEELELAAEIARRIGGSMGPETLRQVAAAAFESGRRDTAAALYGEAIGRCPTLAAASAIVVEAARVGSIGPLRPLILGSLGELCGQWEPAERQRRRGGALDAAEAILAGKGAPSWWRTGTNLGNTAMNVPARADSGRVIALAHNARRLHRGGDQANARGTYAEALAVWRDLARGEGPIPLLDAINGAGQLTLAAVELGTVDDELAADLQALRTRVEPWRHDAGRSTALGQVGLASADLGAWREAAALIVAAIDASSRVSPACWLVTHAPLVDLAPAAAALLRDEPVALALLARLGHEERSAAKVAQRVFSEVRSS